MELKDKDLKSVQETRHLVIQAYEASKQLASMNQQQIDRIVEAIQKAGVEHAVELAKMAKEETGFGIWQDKVIKNLFASQMVYESIKDLKTIGLLRKDTSSSTWDIGVPVGVIAALIPSTNPTSTVIYKTMISLKSGNSIIFSPHPSAKNCILKTIEILEKAAVAAGCPKGAISGISIPTMEATKELMHHKYISLILATGGGAMVKAAYSSGTPAIGVGAGNGPAFIDKSANVKQAVSHILESKTFDNGTICASEQSIIIEKSMESIVTEELQRQGAYLMNDTQTKQLSKFILRANGTMNPAIVGKNCQEIAKYAGLSGVPDDARVLVGRETSVGHDAPYSREKLAPILGLFVEENVDQVLKRSQEILYLEGAGHTFCMHATDQKLIERFALQIPASRFLVNTPGALGGVGATTGLFPALTLGCGAVGGSSTSNNIGPLDLINIKRVGFGIRELSQIRKRAGVSYNEVCNCGAGIYCTCGSMEKVGMSGISQNTEKKEKTNIYGEFDSSIVDEIVEQILKKLA